MKLLNAGCGSVFHPSWINIDLASLSPNIRTYDIRKGLPYPAGTFDACYSSHVLEHLSPEEACKLLLEALRVLKSQGVVRVVVPDLELMVRTYLNALEQVEAGITETEPNYDWIMLELYDQTVRNFSGGEMGRYLMRTNIKNKDFVLSRIGSEAESYQKKKEAADKKPVLDKIKAKKASWFIQKLRILLANNLVALIAGSDARQAFQEGLFRNSGEIHRWMYDRFSLRRLLEQVGFVDVRICQADKSRIPDFNSYELDTIEGKVRKPDSLFMEGTKP